MQNVLIVEDCADSFQLIQRSLEGLAVISWARSIAEAKLMLNAMDFDFVILDLSLPDGNGIELCEAMKQSEALASIPVMMLTAADSVEIKIKAFEAGATDYLTKPFDRREMRARIQAKLLKLLKMKLDANLEVGGITIDLTMQRVATATGEVELTSTEFKLLMVLVSEPNAVLERDALSDKVWGERAETSVRQVDTQISKLRKKIGADKIESVHGVGYKFVA